MEHTNKPPIQTIIAVENENKYHQTEGVSQLISGDLNRYVHSYGEGKYIQKILDGLYTPPP